MPHRLLDVTVTRTCPVRLGVGAFGYSREYEFWKRNMLPNEGTHRQQPYKFIQAMLMLDQWAKVRRDRDGSE